VLTPVIKLKAKFVVGSYQLKTKTVGLHKERCRHFGQNAGNAIAYASLQKTANCQLPTANCQLPTANFSSWQKSAIDKPASFLVLHERFFFSLS